jgi:hypothetical protein
MILSPYCHKLEQSARGKAGKNHTLQNSQAVVTNTGELEKTRFRPGLQPQPAGPARGWRWTVKDGPGMAKSGDGARTGPEAKPKARLALDQNGWLPGPQSGTARSFFFSRA